MLLVGLLALVTPDAEPPQDQRVSEAAWTVAGASAAGFVGGALFAVPAMLSSSFDPLIGMAIGLPVLALAAAFGAFVAELGVARVSTAAAVSAFAGCGTLLGTGVGLLAGWGIGTSIGSSISSGAAPHDDVAAALGAIAGAAVGGLAGSAVGGGLGALWLTPDER